MKSGRFCTFFMLFFFSPYRWLNIIQRGWYAKFSAKWEWECCGQPMRSLRCRGPPSYWSAADAVLLFISFNAIEAKIAQHDSGSCATNKNEIILRELYPLTKVLWLLQNRLKRFIQLESLLFRSVFKPICTLQSPNSQMQKHIWVWNICPAEQLVLVVQGHWPQPPIASGNLI